MRLTALAAGVVTLYVGENFDARRFQRFLYKGLVTPVSHSISPTTIIV